jgi:hypothetical protein
MKSLVGITLAFFILASLAQANMKCYNRGDTRVCDFSDGTSIETRLETDGTYTWTEGMSKQAIEGAKALAAANEQTSQQHDTEMTNMCKAGVYSKEHCDKYWAEKPARDAAANAVARVQAARLDRADSATKCRAAHPNDAISACSTKKAAPGSLEEMIDASQVPNK